MSASSHSADRWSVNPWLHKHRQQWWKIHCVKRYIYNANAEQALCDITTKVNVKLICMSTKLSYIYKTISLSTRITTVSKVRYFLRVDSDSCESCHPFDLKFYNQSLWYRLDQCTYFLVLVVWQNCTWFNRHHIS